ncbi:hypothetical protein [Pseudodesulfovibrio methanolicus]|uniref:Head decoration protein n=1 Tax=Pseudodesulfovibrio methanolicus TaxID=3126690 RepID=A0ABZ2IZG5_9BACT
MTIKGNIGTISAGGDRAHTDHHPAVTGSRRVKADNGVYPIGLIVKEDENAELVPYTGEADTGTPVAVIDEPVDTATETSAFTLAHGTVRQSVLKIGAGDPATEADINKLATIGIYAV